MESSLNLWVSCSIIIGQSRITHRSSSNSSSLTKTRNPYHNRFKHVSNSASFNKFSCLKSQWLWYNILFCGDRNKKLTFFFLTLATTVLLLYVYISNSDSIIFHALNNSHIFQIALGIIIFTSWIYTCKRAKCMCMSWTSWILKQWKSFLFFFVNIYLTSSNTLIFKLKIKTPINIINDVISQ